MPGEAGRTIGKAEATHQIAVIRRAFDAPDDARRDAALAEGFARFGLGFGSALRHLASLEESPGRCAALEEQGTEVLLRWIGGERLTDRADDAERRIAVAEELLARAPGQAAIAGMAARAILSLPEGHPLRDLERAEGLVRARLAAAVDEGEASSFVSAAIDLLGFHLAGEDEAVSLFDQARQKLPIDGEPEQLRNLEVASLSYHVIRAIQARDDGDLQACQVQLALARQRAQGIGDQRSTDRRLRQGRMLFAMLSDVDGGDRAAAASAWSSVRSGEPALDDLDRLAAYHEGRLRLDLGEHEAAVQLLAPLLDGARRDYLEALADAEVSDTGEHFSKLATHQAFALGALGRWDESLRMLDAARSLRLRQRAWLRATPRGRTLLRLERDLQAHERGAPSALAASGAVRSGVADQLRAQVPAQARLLERTRLLRPQLDDGALASPGIAELASVLDPGEAVLSLGNSFKGTLAVWVRHGDSGQPSRARWFAEWTNGWWARLMAGEEGARGWLHAVGAPELGLDHAAVLDDLLVAVDAELGQWIAQVAGELGVRRLTIVAHRFLHLLPFWALPSLAGIEIASAPSLAHLLASRARRRASSRRAVIVENPTGDLPLAAGESEAVLGALGAAGFETERLVRGQARESVVAAALRHAGVLHFGGHGRSEPTRERASALLMNANLGALGLSGADPLGGLAGALGSDAWQDDGDGVQHADLPGRGRLQERRRNDGTLAERWLEFSATGTLWTLYRGEAPLRIAELWSAGDIAVGPRMGRLGIAFLSACETGTGGFEPMIDEYGGLPAALLLAGVGAVVCSLWPVPESLTCVVADLFYRKLADAGEVFDVVAALRDCAATLRSMGRDEAAGRLQALRAITREPAARFMLEATAARLRAGPDCPYARPVHWAAFFVVGAPTLRFAKGPRHGTSRQARPAAHRAG